MSYSKLRLSERRGNLFTLPSTSNLSKRRAVSAVRAQAIYPKIAIKQVGLRYNHHQYNKTLKGLYFKA